MKLENVADLKNPMVRATIRIVEGKLQIVSVGREMSEPHKDHLQKEFEAFKGTEEDFLRHQLPEVVFGRNGYTRARFVPEG